MAVIFVERFAENRWIVANSAARGATVAESGTQRHLGSAEFVRVEIPWGLGSGPLSDGLCSGSEERAGGVGVAVPTPIASDAPLRTRPSAPHRMCTPRARVRASERRANERTNGSLVRLRVGPARLVRLRVGPAKRLVRLRVGPARLVRLRVGPASLVRLRAGPARASDVAQIPPRIPRMYAGAPRRPRGLSFLSTPPILISRAPAAPRDHAAPFGSVWGRSGDLFADGVGRWHLFYAFISAQRRSRIKPPPASGERERRLSFHVRDPSVGFRTLRQLRRGGVRAGRCIGPRRLSWSGSLESRRTSRAGSLDGRPGVCVRPVPRRTSQRSDVRGRPPSLLSASGSGTYRTWAAVVEGQPSLSS